LTGSRLGVDVTPKTLRIDVVGPMVATRPVTFPTVPVSRVDPDSMAERGSSDEMVSLHLQAMSPAECATCHAPQLVSSPDAWTVLAQGAQGKALAIRKPASHPTGTGASVTFTSSSQGVVYLLGTPTSSGDFWVQPLNAQSEGTATVTAEITLQGSAFKPQATRAVTVGAGGPISWDTVLQSTHFSPTPGGFSYISGKTISQIVNSNASGRDDNKMCSECHYSGGPNAYRPAIAQNAQSSFAPGNLVDGRTWRGPTGWASQFPSWKPEQLRVMLSEWLADGGN
jgi:hypothetical protein